MTISYTLYLKHVICNVQNDKHSNDEIFFTILTTNSRGVPRLIGPLDTFPSNLEYPMAASTGWKTVNVALSAGFVEPTDAAILYVAMFENDQAKVVEFLHRNSSGLVTHPSCQHSTGELWQIRQELPSRPSLARTPCWGTSL